MAHVPTRADVERLFDADRCQFPSSSPRSWWVALWVGTRWRLVYDSPSSTAPEVGRRR